MKRIGATLLIVVALAGCKHEHADHKGRPIPERTVTCWDGEKLKDVGPWTCDEHGGKVGRNGERMIRR